MENPFPGYNCFGGIRACFYRLNFPPMARTMPRKIGLVHFNITAKAC